MNRIEISTKFYETKWSKLLVTTDEKVQKIV